MCTNGVCVCVCHSVACANYLYFSATVATAAISEKCNITPSQVGHAACLVFAGYPHISFLDFNAVSSQLTIGCSVPFLTESVAVFAKQVAFSHRQATSSILFNASK